MINGVLIWGNPFPTFDSAFISNLKAHKINWVHILMDCFDANGYLLGWRNESEVVQGINLCKQNGIKIFGMYAEAGHMPNLADASIRQRMIDAAVQAVQKYGLDGYNDGTENWYGGDQAGIDYLNAVSAAVHAIGKLTCFSSMGDYDERSTRILPYVSFDYIVFMGHGSVANSSAAEFRNVLTLSKSPVVWELGCDVSDFASALSRIDEVLNSGSYPKYAGTSIWEYTLMTSNEWASWDAWSRKDVVTPPARTYVFDHWEIDGVIHKENPLILEVT